VPLFLRWLLALAFTQVVEAPIYAFAIGETRARRERWAIALAASLITHPLVWFVIPEATSWLLPDAGRWTAIAVAETFAVVAEALWLATWSVRLSLPLALFANGTSFTLGLFLYVYLGW